MHLVHNSLVTFLAFVFIVSGLSNLGGSDKGLSGVRELNVPDWISRIVGAIEALAALGLIYSLRYPDDFFGWFSLAYLWCAMAGAISLHSRANKLKQAFPSFILITLLSITLVIS